MAARRLRRFCWARSIGGCSATLSKEHVLAKCVHRALGAALSVKIPALDRNVGSDAITIPVLCQRHNNQLSEADSEAAKFISAVRSYFSSPHSRVRDGAQPVHIVHIDGPLLERWMLKTFINRALWTACMATNVPTFDISGGHIVEYVFGAGARPDGHGMYVCQPFPVQRSIEELQGRIFDFQVHSVETNFYSVERRNWGPTYRMPVFLSLTVFGAEFACVGNITILGAPTGEML
jgi:hypothetical protein